MKVLKTFLFAGVVAAAYCSSVVAQQANGHQSDVTAISVSADGNTVASGGTGELLWWDARTGSFLGEIRDKTSSVFAPSVEAASFTPAGSRVVFSLGSTVAMLDVTSKRKGGVGKHNGQVRELVFSSDGKMLYSGTAGTPADAKVWDMSTGRVLKDLGADTALSGEPQQAVFVPGENALLVSYYMGAGEIRLRLLDTTTWQEKARPVALDKDRLYKTLALSPDGKTAFAEQAGNVFAFDATTGKTLYQLPVGVENLRAGKFKTMARMTPDGKLLVLQGALSHEKAFHQFLVWDVAGRKVVSRVSPPPPHTEAPSGALAISPDGKTLYAGRAGKVVRYDVLTGKELGTW